MTSDPSGKENSSSRPSNMEEPNAYPSAMNRPAIDPARIAALIDGRLDDAERIALLAELDASPEAFELYTDVVAALRDTGRETLAAAPIDTPIQSLRLKRRGPGTYRIALALAAVVVFAAAISLFRLRPGIGLRDPVTMAAWVRSGAATTDLWRQTPWSELRGPGDAQSPSARAVRIGARIIDFELLSRARDAGSAEVAQQIAALLDAIPGGSVAAAEFRALAAAGTGEVSEEDRRRAATFAEQVAGERFVRIGAWLESARAAAGQRDTAFFRAAQRRRDLSALREMAGTSPTGANALGRLAAAAALLDWPSISNSAADALGQLASR